MNLQDMKDTFVHPVIDTIVSTDNTTSQAGTYFISHQIHQQSIIS